MYVFRTWTDELPAEASLALAGELALPHALAGGPSGLIIAEAIRRRDYKTLLGLEISYPADASPLDLSECRQALAFFQKFEPLDIGIDKEAAAWEKFLQAEKLCGETNKILKLWSRGEFCFPRDVESVFFRAQRKIAKILGPLPSISTLKLHFGPGATTRTKKRVASTRQKLSAGVSCSEELAPYASQVLGELPHLATLLSVRDFRTTGVTSEGVEYIDEWSEVPVAIETGQLSFVPKNAKTKRAIGTEPVLNGLVQLGIGEFMSRRLLAFGIDLKDQGKNQRLAREGSLTGALATLDLSSASDTISTELVYHLLPLEWASFLNRCRTRKVTYKRQVITQEKFSSMGNGFTFPLESLIFYSLTAACCDDSETVSIYGDDIICPTHRVGSVFRVLRSAGFLVNATKSYWSGCFRESCGADYFRGFDIRPAYVKDRISCASLFVLHNFFFRRGDMHHAARVLGYIPEHLQLFGPDGYGDGHLLGDFVRNYHRPVDKKTGLCMGYCGYLFDTYTLCPKRDMRPRLPGDAVLPHYSVYVRDLVLRDEFQVAHQGILPGMLESPALRGWNKKADSPIDTFPGFEGYKRLSIYVLN